MVLILILSALIGCDSLADADGRPLHAMAIADAPPARPASCTHDDHQHDSAGDCLDLRLDLLREQLEQRRR